MWRRENYGLSQGEKKEKSLSEKKRKQISKIQKVKEKTKDSKRIEKERHALKRKPGRKEKIALWFKIA